MRPYRMTVMRTDMIFIHKLMTIVSMPRPISSRTLSENVVVPIAGMIISFVLIYELITMVIDKNNMHDFDTSLFFRFLFKACIAVMLLSKTFPHPCSISFMKSVILSMMPPIYLMRTGWKAIRQGILTQKTLSETRQKLFLRKKEVETWHFLQQR